MPDPQRLTVSASQTAGLLNTSPYVTRRSLFDYFHDGIDIDERENESMRWGKAVQSFILQRAADKLNLEVIPNFKDIYIRHGELPVGCTEDGSTTCPSRGEGIVEAKSVRWQVWKENWSTSTAPLHIEIQLMTQMLVKRASWGVIACMVGANEDFIMYERRPNQAWYDRIAEEAKRLFADVAAHNRPPAFGEDIELKGINQIWPQVKAGVKLEDMDNIVLGQMLVDYADFQERASFAEANKKSLRTKILDITKDASEVRVNSAYAKIKKSQVDASVLKLPGEIRSGLMIALSVLDGSAKTAGENNAAHEALDKTRALAACAAALNWEKITRAASTRNEIDVTPIHDDPPPADTLTFNIEG